jgi:hypothetical protein
MPPASGSSVPPPPAVYDDFLARFRAALERSSLVADPAHNQRKTAMQWNRAAAAHPAWPQRHLSMPDHRLYYTPAWTTYPPSLLQDIEAWLASLRSGGVQDLLSDTALSRTSAD